MVLLPEQRNVLAGYSRRAVAQIKYDPLSSGASLTAIIHSGYFGRTHGEVLCFGAGGSAIAVLLHLINRKEEGDRPPKFTFVNRSQGRLDHAR